ncbi:ABC-type transport system involved in multi-copper enzyme maturation permease subunit [Arthrobacter stackebrandtii]|uniref:ABC-type transport system involved in multi-copper enzyme maturation permease subunit n=1 Tax=Arthrobacter stackebrandtii TaxID=272161 RepID=A0ABS4YW26_9MICC|nr:ABC transporter permease [Arthrobacter stackebrandtii]MBP2413021.1 ABC-type transport system involved in multi-copper enzyme maturation permease subunit [Arthrobacter stackebrandtii]
MTTFQNPPAPQASAPAPGPGRLGRYTSGVAAVVGMELRQRLRSRGWYIMLAIWFGLIWLVTALTWISWKAQYSYNFDPGFGRVGPGPLIFEAVLAFVLLFGLLVAPAFSANAISGDRSAGTLAIMQVTLLRPGQLLWGKFLASWIAALAFLVVSVPFLVFGIAQGGLGVGYILVALLMLAIELGVVCALGVGISALAYRPLFSIVVTYLTVAALAFGTLIAFGLGMMLSNGTVQANQTYYKGMEMYQGELDPEVEGSGEEMYPAPPAPKNITDENAEYACFGPLVEQPSPRSERVAWMLAMNPFVVVADAIPYPDRPDDGRDYYPTGVFETMSQGARYAQAGPEATYPCANGKVATVHLEQNMPLWPLGLGLQLLVAAGILALGWRALRTPAGRLPKGTRVA